MTEQLPYSTVTNQFHNQWNQEWIRKSEPLTLASQRRAIKIESKRPDHKLAPCTPKFTIRRN
jgi:hypothetical protein